MEITPQQPEMQTPPKKSWFSMHHTGTTIAVALAVLIAATAIAWSKTPKQEEKIGNKPIEKQAQTTDWKTYRNDKYGFEVKYMPDWTVKEDGIVQFESLASQKAGEENGRNCRDNDEKTPCMDEFNGEKVIFEAMLGDRHEDQLKGQRVFNNVTFQMYQESGLAGLYTYYSTIHKGVGLVFSADETNVKYLEQILSTIKLIRKEAVDIDAIKRDMLAGSKVGTKVYYSDKLDIAFTYAPLAEGYPAVKITEKGNKITVEGQWLEVFMKDSELSLKQTLEQEFLRGYNSKDCFVKIYESTKPNYVSAGISFPHNNDGGYWWKNGEKCPKDYTETNAIQYFLMNTEVPSKFIFVRVGQDGAASDGFGFNNWDHSIRIVH